MGNFDSFLTVLTKNRTSKMLLSDLKNNNYMFLIKITKMSLLAYQVTMKSPSGKVHFCLSIPKISCPLFYMRLVTEAYLWFPCNKCLINWQMY